MNRHRAPCFSHPHSTQTTTTITPPPFHLFETHFPPPPRRLFRTTPRKESHPYPNPPYGTVIPPKEIITSKNASTSISTAQPQQNKHTNRVASEKQKKVLYGTDNPYPYPYPPPPPPPRPKSLISHFHLHLYFPPPAFFKNFIYIRLVQRFVVIVKNATFPPFVYPGGGAGRDLKPINFRMRDFVLSYLYFVKLQSRGIGCWGNGGSADRIRFFQVQVLK